MRHAALSDGQRILICLGVVGLFLLGSRLSVDAQCVIYEDQRLTVPDPSREFGTSVAVHGDVLVAGMPAVEVAKRHGVAFVYRFDGETWGQEERLLSDSADDYAFAHSVAVFGPTILIGVPGAYFPPYTLGAAFVFRFDGTSWVKTQELTVDSTHRGDSFAAAVALDGTVAAVGAPGADGADLDAGAVHVFRDDGSEMLHDGSVYASDGLPWDYFGWSVAVNGDALLVGAPGHDEAGERAGAAYVFRHDGSRWRFEQELLASDAAPEARFGYTVALKGDVALIGAQGDHETFGAAYVFVFDGNCWTEQQKLVPGESVVGNRFGCAVAADEGVLAVGAFISTKRARGAVHLFRHDGSAWIEQYKALSSDLAWGQHLGYSAALSGPALVAGATAWNDNQGAVLVFDARELRLTAEPAVVRPGDLLTFTTVCGKLGHATLLCIVGVDTAPVFIPVAAGSFDATGNWSSGFTVPPGVPSFQAFFQTFALGYSGRVAMTVRELVTFTP
ncbi:MAG: hypothetical protein AB1486_24250 [Planctomycetota bacterium]